MGGTWSNKLKKKELDCFNFEGNTCPPTGRMPKVKRKLNPHVKGGVFISEGRRGLTYCPNIVSVQLRPPDIGIGIIGKKHWSHWLSDDILSFRNSSYHVLQK